MLSGEEILKLAEEKSWTYICYKIQLPPEFMEEYWSNLDYYWISKYQKLSEEFMEKYWRYMDYNCISKYQTLSESFIEKHWNHLEIFRIYKYQKLSEEFMENHWDSFLDYQVRKCKFCKNKTKFFRISCNYHYYCPTCQR